MYKLLDQFGSLRPKSLSQCIDVRWLVFLLANCWDWHYRWGEPGRLTLAHCICYIWLTIYRCQGCRLWSYYWRLLKFVYCFRHSPSVFILIFPDENESRSMINFKSDLYSKRTMVVDTLRSLGRFNSPYCPVHKSFEFRLDSGISLFVFSSLWVSCIVRTRRELTWVNKLQWALCSRRRQNRRHLESERPQ